MNIKHMGRDVTVEYEAGLQKVTLEYLKTGEGEFNAEMRRCAMELTEAAVKNERERCINLICFDCRNYPERPLVRKENGQFFHKLIGADYKCRATAIREGNL